MVGEASRGEEAQERLIRSLCTSLGLDDIVQFPGYRDDIPAILAAFDLFVFPSHAEAFGVALIEAMATGIPVVSTNCDGVLDIVVDGDSGLFVDPRSPSQIAEALRRLVPDEGLRERLGRQARERVVALFDVEAQTDRIEEVYCGLLAGADRQ
jgi:glycosyltransferase involved in cell wall biosynthesis